jgi:hypothetical protein
VIWFQNLLSNTTFYRYSTAIKKSLMDLRLTLSKLPWADGRPVQDPVGLYKLESS